MASYQWMKVGNKEGQIDIRGNRTYEITWLIRTDTPDCDLNDMDSTAPFHYGDQYQSDQFAYLLQKRYTQSEGDKTFYTCTCTFTSDTDSRGFVPDRATQEPLLGTGGSGNLHTPTTPGSNTSQVLPQNRPWVVRLSTRDRKIRMDKDVSIPPKPVVTTAGEPFSNVFRTVPNLVINMTLYRPSFDDFWIRTYKGAVNDAYCLGYDEGEVLCTNYTAQTVYDTVGGVTMAFFEIGIELECNKDGWWLEILNAGTMVRKTSIAKPEQILDKSGAPITNPVPIREEGDRPAENVNEFHYLYFQQYPFADFSNIIY